MRHACSRLLGQLCFDTLGQLRVLRLDVRRKARYWLARAVHQKLLKVPQHLGLGIWRYAKFDQMLTQILCARRRLRLRLDQRCVKRMLSRSHHRDLLEDRELDSEVCRAEL